MKLAIVTLISFALSLILYSFANPYADTYSLTIEVKNFRNAKGVVQFTLYNKGGSIPDEDYEKYYKIGKTTLKENSAQFEFKNLPKGTYAVNILHDENENGKIDKGFILPIEGIGFSNFQSIGLTNRPNFEKASFEVKENKTINVKVIYM